MIVFAFILGIAAFACFGLATDRHGDRLFGRRPARNEAVRLRRTAWMLLAIDFIVALIGWGPVFGAIGWTATVLAGAALTFLTLNLLAANTSRGR